MGQDSSPGGNSLVGASLSTFVFANADHNITVKCNSNNITDGILVLWWVHGYDRSGGDLHDYPCGD